MRCDSLNNAVTQISLTGNNSPFILNNSYIYNSSVNVILNGGASRRWCNGTVKAAYGPQIGMYCSTGLNIPYFYIVKRYDLISGLGGPYFWTNNYFEIIFQPRSPATVKLIISLIPRRIRASTSSCSVASAHAGARRSVDLLSNHMLTSTQPPRPPCALVWRPRAARSWSCTPQTPAKTSPGGRQSWHDVPGT
jgi:hypothetical protein